MRLTPHLIAVLVWALAQAETPHGVPARPGPAGETGRWQLTPAVRKDRGAWLRARGEAVTDENIAIAQVIWLQNELQRNGKLPVEFNIALAWNAGLERSISGHAPTRASEFAARVTYLTQAAP